MARSAVSLTLVLGLGAVAFALVAIFLQPSREGVQQLLYGNKIAAPHFLGDSSKIEVLDASQDVKYVGSLAASGVEHFQNIFYAEDTSGNNRFAPPVPFRPSKGSIVDATSPGAWCPQGTGDVLPFTSYVANVSEHCLSLRIARPRGTRPDAKLPVVVWIHGGGHALGSAYEMLYEPDGLVMQAASDGPPLIFVAINYRLGIFGFATSQALIEAKHTNAGLRDQRAALECRTEIVGV